MRWRRDTGEVEEGYARGRMGVEVSWRWGREGVEVRLTRGRDAWGDFGACDQLDDREAIEN